jgi:alpha-tubulin suppressor-like RCC1 family protein
MRIRHPWSCIALTWSALGVLFVACGDPNDVVIPKDTSGIAENDSGESRDGNSVPSNAPDGAAAVAPSDAAMASDAAGDAPPPPSAVVAVAAGLLSACALRADGTVWCWGANDMGELGALPSAADQTCGVSHCQKDPIRIPVIDDATQIAVGIELACALRGDGSVWCWGKNDFGQLGHTPGADGDGTCSGVACNAAPQKIALPGNVHAARIVAGWGIVCARTRGAAPLMGDVYCWGNNGHWTVGLAVADAIVPTPNKISGFDGDVVDLDVSGDTRHACAVKQDGSVWCWGDDYQGRIGALETSGPGNTNIHAIPEQVREQAAADADAGDVGLGAPLGGARAVRLGDGASCALKADGTVWCWGNDALAALADVGPYDAKMHPGARRVVGLPAPVATLERHSRTSYAIDAQGVAWAWGDNAFGELANGTLGGVPCSEPPDSGGACGPAPTASGALLGARSIATGTRFGVVIKPDRTVWAWGANDRAQLGHASGTGGDIVCAGDLEVAPCNATPTQVMFP